MAIYTELPTVNLATPTPYTTPSLTSSVIYPEDHALQVMVNFQDALPHACQSHVLIDDALKMMEEKGIHHLLVTDDDDKMIGLVTSEDILGEKPIKISQAGKSPREDIKVEAVMTQLDNLLTFAKQDLRHALVGSLILTMKAHKQHYAVVIDNIPDMPQVVGLFSLIHISKHMKGDVVSDAPTSSNLAELSRIQSSGE